MPRHNLGARNVSDYGTGITRRHRRAADQGASCADSNYWIAAPDGEVSPQLEKPSRKPRSEVSYATRSHPGNRAAKSRIRQGVIPETAQRSLVSGKKSSRKPRSEVSYPTRSHPGNRAAVIRDLVKTAWSYVGLSWRLYLRIRSGLMAYPRGLRGSCRRFRTSKAFTKAVMPGLTRHPYQISKCGSGCLRIDLVLKD